MMSIGTPNYFRRKVSPMSIGSRVKAMRLAKGMNQKQLAKAAGISAPSLSDIENGVTKSLKADTALALGKVLECSTDWLNTGKGTPAAPAHIKSIEQTELLAVFEHLTEPHKIALLSTARALLQSQEMAPSAVNPFPKVRQ